MHLYLFSVHVLFVASNASVLLHGFDFSLNSLIHQHLQLFTDTAVKYKRLVLLLLCPRNDELNKQKLRCGVKIFTV